MNEMKWLTPLKILCFSFVHLIQYTKIIEPILTLKFKFYLIYMKIHIYAQFWQIYLDELFISINSNNFYKHTNKDIWILNLKNRGKTQIGRKKIL